MSADTRIAAVVFIVPFTIAVCVVAVQAELSSGASFTGLLVLSQNPGGSDDSDGGPDDR